MFSSCKLCLGSEMQVLSTGPYLGDTGSTVTLEMLTSENFQHYFSISLSCSYQYYYHTKQKYCIFFSPKVYSVTLKSAKRRLRPGIHPWPGWGSWSSPDSLVEGDHPCPNPHFSSTPSPSWYRRLITMTPPIDPSDLFFMRPGCTVVFSGARQSTPSRAEAP